MGAEPNPMAVDDNRTLAEMAIGLLLSDPSPDELSAAARQLRELEWYQGLALGRKLRLWRECAGLNMSEVARSLEIGVAYLSGMETMTFVIPFEMFERWAKVVGMGLTWGEYEKESATWVNVHPVALTPATKANLDRLVQDSMAGRAPSTMESLDAQRSFIEALIVARVNEELSKAAL